MQPCCLASNPETAVVQSAFGVLRSPWQRWVQRLWLYREPEGSSQQVGEVPHDGHMETCLIQDMYLPTVERFCAMCVCEVCVKCEDV